MTLNIFTLVNGDSIKFLQTILSFPNVPMSNFRRGKSYSRLKKLKIKVKSPWTRPNNVFI